MKRFVKTAAAFCLVLAAVLILADYPLSRSMREVHTFGMDTWRDIFEGKAGADILIQGDSRAFNACYQPVFDSLTGLPAYNLTTIGNPFLMQEFRYGMYRGHNRKPRVILQFTDEFFLGTAISDYDRVQYLPWMWDKSFTGGLLSVSRRLFLQNAFPVLRYHGYRPWSLAREPRMTRNGFYLPDYELFRDSVFHHPAEPERAFYYSGYMHDRLTRFLRNASEEGIRVILICPPLHESLAFKDGGKEEMVRDFLGHRARFHLLPRQGTSQYEGGPDLLRHARPLPERTPFIRQLTCFSTRTPSRFSFRWFSASTGSSSGKT